METGGTKNKTGWKSPLHQLSVKIERNRHSSKSMDHAKSNMFFQMNSDMESASCIEHVFVGLNELYWLLEGFELFSIHAKIGEDLRWKYPQSFQILK